jgi:hypothetical protein
LEKAREDERKKQRSCWRNCCSLLLALKLPSFQQLSVISAYPTMLSFLFRRATAATAATAGVARAFRTTSPRSVARITIVGHLADTPEPQTASTEEYPREYIKYAVASNSGSKDNRQISWFRVTDFVVDGSRRDFLLSLQKGYA